MSPDLWLDLKVLIIKKLSEYSVSIIKKWILILTTLSINIYVGTCQISKKTPVPLLSEKIIKAITATLHLSISTEKARKEIGEGLKNTHKGYL